MSLEAHLEELIKKHRALDEEITELEKHHNVTEEIRKLKTQKLWLKDEIHRIAPSSPAGPDPVGAQQAASPHQPRPPPSSGQSGH